MPAPALPKEELPEIEDENTRAGTDVLTEEETPAEAGPAATGDGENTSSSSSEDRPILSRIEVAGTKRKAEVLSEESGKIGVTITTSGPSSPKTPKLPPVKPAKSPSHTTSNNSEPPVLTPVANPVPDSSPPTTKPPKTSPVPPPAKPPATLHANNNGGGNGGVLSDIVPALTSPGSDYWLARNPVVDQVFITDVTVNLKTVTIRECKTEEGFFKGRGDEDNHSKPSDIL